MESKFNESQQAPSSIAVDMGEAPADNFESVIVTADDYLFNNALADTKLSDLITQEMNSITPGKAGEHCFGKPQYFFNEKGDRRPTVAKRAAVAAALCRTCPIINKCLQESFQEIEKFGILDGTWGGITYDNRRKLVKNRQRAVTRQENRKNATLLQSDR